MAECTELYTKDELIAFIKKIDEQLLTGVSRSDLDTGQSRQSFSVSTNSLKRDREYYMSLLKQVDPVCYHRIKGASVIKFRGPSC